MRRRHLKGVMAIERQVYPRPWSPNLFLAEMNETRDRLYLVARVDRDVVGYGGLMVSGDEGHVTTIAVDPEHHRRKVGTRLLFELIHGAMRMGATAVSLEVRVTNWGAQRMYGRFGFRPVGHPEELLPGDERGRADHVDRRHPDAGVRAAARTLDGRCAAGRSRPGRPVGAGAVGAVARPVRRRRVRRGVNVLGIETSCDETAVAVVADGTASVRT